MVAMKHALCGLAALSLLAGVVGASPPKPKPDPKAPAAKGYPAVAALFKKQCLGCHSGTEPAGGYDVSTYAKVVGSSKHGKMVVPGKPAQSPLIAYLKGTKKPPMPMGTKGLKPAELKIVSDWIAAGAKNR